MVAPHSPVTLVIVVRMWLIISSWVRRVWEVDEWLRWKCDEPLSSDSRPSLELPSITFYHLSRHFSVSTVRQWNGLLVRVFQGNSWLFRSAHQYQPSCCEIGLFWPPQVTPPFWTSILNRMVTVHHMLPLSHHSAPACRSRISDWISCLCVLNEHF